MSHVNAYDRVQAARRRHGIHPFVAHAPAGASIKAYRVPGGTVVTIARPDGRRRRYQVGVHHFRALTVRFNARNWGGAYLRSSLDVQCHGRVS